MSKSVRYNSPLGEKIKEPSQEFLRKVIFEYRADYWSKESTGDSAIVIQKNSEDLWLIFFYDEPYGFFLYYNVEFVPLKKGTALKDSLVVEHIVGSNPMRIPS